MRPIFIILIFFCFTANAISFIPSSKRSNQSVKVENSPQTNMTKKKSKSKMTDLVTRTDAGTIKLDKKIQKLMEATEANSELLRQRSARPLIYDGDSEIQTARVFRGTLLNSIRSTNLESPLLVRVDEDEGLPSGTKFDCEGVTKYKRVQTNCQTIILPGKTLSVNVTILNEDGSAGLTGKYYDGKEEFIAGTVMMAGVSGLIASKQQTVETALGTITANNSRNQTLGSAMSMASAASDIMKNEIEAKEPIVYIDAGKKVLIYFRQDFSFRKRSPLIDLDRIKQKKLNQPDNPLETEVNNEST